MTDDRRPPPSTRELAETIPAPRRAGFYQAGEVLLGRYRLDRQLAVGGMGEVWVATNLPLDQPVGLKLLRRASRNPAGAERLLREARVAARLQHRAIVRVFDAGQTDDHAPFLVMELLKGADVTDLVHRYGPLDGVRAAQLVVSVLSGLAAAHAHGVVHRDLKPDNIFLAELEGGEVQPKIIDFGIAHVAVQASTKLTSPGMLLGTPEYMSPEQVECRDDIDSRADIWAVGVTLYFLVTGDTPFVGADLPTLFDAIMEGHVPFPTRARNFDGKLWAILMDCLRRDREDRFQRAEDLEAVLIEWLLARGVTDDYAGRPLRKTPAEPSSHVPTSGGGSGRIGSPGGTDRTAETQTGPSSTLDRAIFSNLKKRIP